MNSIYDPTCGSGCILSNIDISPYSCLVAEPEIQRTDSIDWGKQRDLSHTIRVKLYGTGDVSLPVSYLNIFDTLDEYYLSKFSLNLPIIRNRVLAVRTGQQKFKSSLLALYGAVCAITGKCPLEVLDAAHIIGYADSYNQSVENGMLLRTDIHRLFDSNLIGVNPVDDKIVLAKALLGSQYEHLNGLNINRANRWVPDPEFLAAKWLSFCENNL